MSSSKAVSRKQVEKALARGDNHIGNIVMWALKDAVASTQELQDLFTANGLDWEEWGMGEISARTTFRTALRLAKQSLEKQGLLFRPIDDNDDHVVIGIVNEKALKKTQDLQYSLECRIAFDKKNDTVKTDDGGKPKDQQHAAGRKVKDLFKQLVGYYTTRDFVKLLTGSVGKMDPVTMRSNGGVYFVPSTHHAELMKLRAIINSVGTSYVTALPVYDDADSKQDVGRVAQDALEQELATLKAQIDGFVADPPRRDTMRNRLEEFQALRARAAMFGSMLTVTVSDLDQGITDCEDTLKKLIGIETKRLEEKKSKGKSVEKETEAERVIRKVQEESKPKKVAAAPKKAKKAKATKQPAGKKSAAKKKPASKKSKSKAA